MVRPYRSSDRRAVMAAFRSNVPEFFHASETPWMRKYLGERGNTNFVVSAGGFVVGYGGYAVDRYQDRAVLCWGLIARDHHRSGLGSVLLLHRLVHLSKRRDGARHMVLNTIPEVAGFFERHGFERYAEWDRGFRSGLDMVELRLDVRKVGTVRLERALARAIGRAEARCAT